MLIQCVYVVCERPTAVAAHLKSEQLLLFAFAPEYRGDAVSQGSNVCPALAKRWVNTPNQHFFALDDNLRVLIVTTGALNYIKRLVLPAIEYKPGPAVKNTPTILDINFDVLAFQLGSLPYFNWILVRAAIMHNI